MSDMEAIYDLLRGIGPSGERRAEWLRAHVAALEAERDAAVADNAALTDALNKVFSVIRTTHLDMGGKHRYAITNGLTVPEDVEHARAAMLSTHPGAALLEEHRKALESAHSDGRRHALLQALDRLGMDSAAMYGDPEATDSRLSDELWNHVRWLEVRARNEGLEEAAQRIGDLLAAWHRVKDLKAWDSSSAREYLEERIRAMKEPESD